MKNLWQRILNSPATTAAGLIGGLGGVLIAFGSPLWLVHVGQFMAGVGTLLLGLCAADNKPGDGPPPAPAVPPKLTGLVLACMVALGVTGCASLKPGADPVVVNAERTTAAALDTFDVFLKYEFDHREELEKISPEIHQAAETIRKNAPDWIKSVRALTLAYKWERTPGSDPQAVETRKANLMTAIAVLEQGVAQARHYIQIGGMK